MRPMVRGGSDSLSCRGFAKLPRLPTGGRLQKGRSGGHGRGGGRMEGGGEGMGVGLVAEAASRRSSGVTMAGTGRPGLRSE